MNPAKQAVRLQLPARTGVWCLEVMQLEIRMKHGAGCTRAGAAVSDVGDKMAKFESE